VTVNAFSGAGRSVLVSKRCG